MPYFKIIARLAHTGKNADKTQNIARYVEAKTIVDAFNIHTHRLKGIKRDKTPDVVEITREEYYNGIEEQNNV